MISAIILAGGESKRFGSLKQIYKFKNKTFIDHILENLIDLPLISEIVIGLGYDMERVMNNIKTHSEKIKIAMNYNYKDGQISTLKECLKVCSHFNKGFLVTLVDHPFISKNTYFYLINEFINYGFQKIIIPVYENKKGHPVIFPCYLKKELMNCPLEEGARFVIKNYESEVRLINTLDKFILADIDKIEDFEKSFYEWRLS